MHSCDNCSYKANKPFKFCPQCGSEKLTAASTAQETTQAAHTQPSDGTAHQQGMSVKSSNKKLITIIGSIVLGVAIIAIVAYFATTLFFSKNTKELYLLSELKTFKATISENQKYGVDSKDLMKKLKSSASESEITLSGSVSSDADEIAEEIDLLADILEKHKVSIVSKQNPEQQWAEVDLKLASEDDELLNLLLAYFDSTFAFQDKADDSAMYYIPLDGLEESDSKEMLNLEKEWKQIQEKYSKVLLKLLKDEYFTLNKDVSYEAGDKKLSVDQIIIKLDQAQMTELLIALFDELRSDKETLETLATFIVQTEEIEPHLTEAEQVAYLVEQMEEGLYDARSDLVQSEVEMSFQMKVYVDSKHMILERDATLSLQESSGSEEIELQFNRTNWKTSKNKYESSLKLALFVDSYGDLVELSLQANTDTLIEGKVKDAISTIVFEVNENDYREVGGELSFRSRLSSDMKEADRYDFKLVLLDLDEAPVITGSFERQVHSLTGSEIKQTYSGEIGVEVMQYGTKESVNVGLQMDVSSKINEKLEKPKLEEGAIHLNDEMSEADQRRFEHMLEKLVSNFNY